MSGTSSATKIRSIRQELERTEPQKQDSGRQQEEIKPYIQGIALLE